MKTYTVSTGCISHMKVPRAKKHWVYFKLFLVKCFIFLGWCRQKLKKWICSIEEKYILLNMLFAGEIVRHCNIGSEFLLESRCRVQS